MKNVMILCLTLASLGLQAQRTTSGAHRHGHEPRLTTEQKVALHTKRMTLALDLNDAQAEQLTSLLQERFELRTHAPDSLQSRDPQERFEHLSNRMDAQIAFQRELKKVLTDTQYERWKEHRQHKRHKGRQGRRHGRR